MANPNIVNVTDIRGKSNTLSLTTSTQTLLNNPAGSNKILKINTILVTNISGSAAPKTTISFFEEDDLGGTSRAFANTVVVPNDATLVVIDKNTSIYLEEDRSIGVFADANNDLVSLISYEEIS